MEKPLRIFKNLVDVLDTLKDDGMWCFYWDAILTYFFYGKEPEIDDPVNYTLWNSIKSLVDIANSDRRAITSPNNGKNHKSKE